MPQMMEKLKTFKKIHLGSEALLLRQMNMKYKFRKCHKCHESSVSAITKVISLLKKFNFFTSTQHFPWILRRHSKIDLNQDRHNPHILKKW